ncbi:MAG: hypothetical protein LQ341_004133 [Variospora aurantia]|nr:MAG: hypothetical protein LQ341_004133 [Variospora aurantia]
MQFSNRLTALDPPAPRNPAPAEHAPKLTDIHTQDSTQTPAAHVRASQGSSSTARDGSDYRQHCDEKSRNNSSKARTSLGPKHVQLDAVDAEQRYKIKKEDNPSPIQSVPPKVVISFGHGDPENPYNWSTVCASSYECRASG